MNLIANVNEHWGIGRNGELLCRIKADTDYFRKTTMGKTLIYGRKTLDSLPGKKPLPGRKNIVITSNYTHVGEQTQHSAQYFGTINRIAKLKNGDSMSGPRIFVFRDQHGDGEKYPAKPYKNTSLFLVKNIYEAIVLANMLELDTDDVFVCGGESIYKELAPFCKTAYLTINNCKTSADTFFPNLNELGWTKNTSNITESEDEISGLKYYFCTYINNDVKSIYDIKE